MGLRAAVVSGGVSMPGRATGVPVTLTPFPRGSPQGPRWEGVSPPSTLTIVTGTPVSMRSRLAVTIQGRAKRGT